MLPTNPIRWLTILVGLGSIAAGVDYLLDGGRDKTGQALVILIPFGISMIVLALARSAPAGSSAGVEAQDGATVFLPRPGSVFTSVVGMGGFFCLGLGMVLFPGDSPDTDQGAVRGIGAVIALLFATLILFTLRSLRHRHMVITLTPQELVQRGRTREIRARWDDVTRVGYHQWRGSRHTVLEGTGVLVPHQMMAADPAVFHALVVHVHATPADRGLLATPGGVEALRRLGLDPGG